MTPNSPECSFIHALMAGSLSTAPLKRSNSVLIVAPLFSFEIYGYVAYTRRPLACRDRRGMKGILSTARYNFARDLPHVRTRNSGSHCKMRATWMRERKLKGMQPGISATTVRETGFIGGETKQTDLLAPRKATGPCLARALERPLLRAGPD